MDTQYCLFMSAYIELHEILDAYRPHPSTAIKVADQLAIKYSVSQIQRSSLIMAIREYTVVYLGYGSPPY